MGIIEALLGGTPKDQDAIKTQPLRFTGSAGIGSAVVLMLGLIPSVVNVIDDQRLTSTQQIGAFALICAGVLGISIAAAGDVLARAYASAWTTSPENGEKAHPIIKDLVALYRPGASEPAHGDGAVPVPMSERLLIRDKDGQTCHVLAIQALPGNQTRYLVAAETSAPRWIDGGDVRFAGIEPVMEEPHRRIRGVIWPR